MSNGEQLFFSNTLYVHHLYIVVKFYVSDGVSFCAVLFPTRCLGWYLGLNVSVPVYSFIKIFKTGGGRVVR